MYKPVLSVLLLTLAASFAAGAQDFKLEAHRGICNRYPENTVLSFKQAAKVPVYYGIETDVQETSDGVLVLMHDLTIDRTTDHTGKVSDYTWKELKKIRIAEGSIGWAPKWEGKLRIPTFKEYLKICRKNGKVPYVELKLLSDEGIRNTIRTLHKMGFSDQDYVLTSTTRHYLEEAGKYSSAKKEFMKKTFTVEELEELADKGFVIRPASVAITQEVVDKCKELGLEMEAYVLPVGDPGKLAQLKAWGIQGATCNDWLGLGLREEGTPLPRTVAHRGLHDKAERSENSIAALRACKDLGVYAVELDVWRTVDGTVVVNHNCSFPTDSLHRRIEKTEFKSLSSSVLLPNSEKIPTLEQFVKTAKRLNLRLVIEIKKHQGVTIPCCEEAVRVVREQGYLNRCDWISFDYDACKWLARALPGSLVGYLEGDKSPSECHSDGISCIDYPADKLTPQWVAEAQAFGMKVNVWTVDDEAAIRHFKALGVDYITTNDPIACKGICGENDFEK